MSQFPPFDRFVEMSLKDRKATAETATTPTAATTMGNMDEVDDALRLSSPRLGLFLGPDDDG